MSEEDAFSTRPGINYSGLRLDFNGNVLYLALESTYKIDIGFLLHGSCVLTKLSFKTMHNGLQANGFIFTSRAAGRTYRGVGSGLEDFCFLAMISSFCCTLRGNGMLWEP